MEVAPPNNEVIQNISPQRCCSKKKYMIPVIIIRGLALILCIIHYTMKVTNLEIYKEFEAQNPRVEETDNRNNVYHPYNEYGQYYNQYSSYKMDINAILDFKKTEDEDSLLILIPTVISFILKGFLFLHFWFEEECCCGQKSGCLASFHIFLNSSMNCMVGFIYFIGSLMDYLYRRDTMDKYSKYFIGSDFQMRNNLNKAIDLILIFMFVCNLILMIIVFCYVYRENKLCEIKLSCCDLCRCMCGCDCEINLCTLCTCCDNPPLTATSTNPINNSPYIQQQNVILVQQNASPMNNNNNSAVNSVYSDHSNVKNIGVNNYPINLQESNTTDLIHVGKKKLTNGKKKKKAKKDNN
jgi:hypothetical protein